MSTEIYLLTGHILSGVHLLQLWLSVVLLGHVQHVIATKKRSVEYKCLWAVFFMKNNDINKSSKPGNSLANI